MDRQIVCFQIPTLEIALARAAEPSLRGRPVAIAPLQSPRARLFEVSQEAQQDGVLAGMPMDQARRCCPSLHLLPPDPARVRQAQQALDTVAAAYAPIWEPVRPGHLFLDLTGTTRLFGPTSDAALRIQRDVARLHGLAGVAGVGSNKLVARMAATLMHPLQLCEVRPGSEPPFLAPLPVSVLPGLSRAHAKAVLGTLADLNLLTWGDIAEIPLPALELVLGSHAMLVRNWAHGIDLSPVLPLPQQPRLELSVTLDPDELDDGRLLGHLYGLLERLCRDLRRQQRVCQRLTLTVRSSDQVEVTRCQRLDAGTAWEAELFPYVTALFARCARRRVRVRMMTVGAEALAPPDGQLWLFDESFPSPSPLPMAHCISKSNGHTGRGESQGGGLGRGRRLARALDRVRDRFGDAAIRYGRTSNALAPQGRGQG
jgi:DNA polymerase-4